MKHYTNIEQSKKLKELGLPIKTADCSFRPYHYDPCKKEHFYFEDYPKWEPPVGIYDIPCWSLGALLNLMPDILFTKEKNMYYFGHPDSNHIEQNTSSIIAAYSMIVWLLENNYIKK